MNIIPFSHPEANVGDVFFSNMTVEQFELFGWVSKRKGQVSYNGEGARLNEPNWFPVFVTNTELAARHTDLTKERRQWRMLLGLHTSPVSH